MASSGNFCIMNPLDITAGGTLSEGNLKASTGANADYHIGSTFGIDIDNDTNGYYFEVRIVSRSRSS